jgi:CheY-like chemotaxis protein
MPRTDDPDARPAIRVLVVDADRRVRQSLCGLLDIAGGMRSVGAASDARAAMERIDQGDVDLVLLDPRLPDVDAGRALVARIRDRWPDLPVVTIDWSDGVGEAEGPGIATVPGNVQPDALMDALRTAAVAAAARRPGPRSLAGRSGVPTRPEGTSHLG